MTSQFSQSATLRRVLAIPRHVRLGLWFGYPPCCVLRWSVQNALPDRLRGHQAEDRGVVHVGPSRRRLGETAQYVPCGVFHRNGLWHGLPATRGGCRCGCAS